MSASLPAEPTGRFRRLSRLRRVSSATVVFVLFICIVLLALDALLAIRTREAELRQADVATANLARSVAQQMNSMISEVEHVLGYIVFELERQEGKAADYVRLQPLLVTQASTVQQIHDIFVFDDESRLMVSSQPHSDDNIGNQDYGYFIRHRDSPSQRMGIGTPMKSRTTGVWVIPLSRRFDDAEGNFAGVVLATIRVDHVMQTMEGFDMGQQGAIALVSDEGRLLARRPYFEADLGRNIAGSVLHKEMVSQGASGQITMRSPIDHVLRRISFQHLKDQPLLVPVALAQDELLAEWRHTTFVQTAIVLLVCGLTGLSGSFLIRAIRRQGRSEDRLQRAQEQLQTLNTQLQHLAQHDGLTGLPNRRSFDEHLSRTVAQAARSRQSVTVVMLDVDHFKIYNDRYGHPSGDQCLQSVSRAVASAASRPANIVARYGGEEFVALLPCTDLAGALTVAEAMRRAVSNLRLENLGNPPLNLVTISVGVATYMPGPEAQDAAELLRNADIALYRAKAAGRNRVEVYD